MSQQLNISLCICTYNRCEQLNQTLQSLVSVRHEFVEGDEILVVDNNSNDETRSVITGFEKKLRLLYFFEPVQGLSVARNKGLSEFKNSMIIFIDDDITITSGFLTAYRRAANEYSDASFFGGKIIVDWGDNQPKWFRAYDLPLINGLIGYYDQSKENPNYNLGSLLPYGANFALRRNLVDSIGSFDPGFGVNGAEIGRGEETEFLSRALGKGFIGRYIDEAVVFHRFQTERLNSRYLYRYGFQKGLGGTTNSPVNLTGSRVVAALFLLRGLYQLFKIRKDRYYQCVINAGMQIGSRLPK